MDGTAWVIVQRRKKKEAMFRERMPSHVAGGEGAESRAVRPKTGRARTIP